MDFENELWKEIEGYGGRYQVSNCGRIWNVATQSMMKPQLKKTGYWKAKAENLVKLPLLLLAELPKDMRERADPNAIIEAVLGIGTHND